MSTTDDTATPALPASSRETDRELDRAYDDQDDPSILTVFPADAEWPEIGTTWISVDVDYAVSAADWR
ncbi:MULTISPECIES: hypothetical protein [unclassified Halorhabdus]|uniref:DUF7511 domain-containing protein n=1 Tax=unclassified Halorhabdus TaxID=2621901 RepID=UPI0023DA6488|nr:MULTISPECIES: hypothetical protein [unclassified Halorhabdus]WEL18951.1 Uncharacterized protein SVXHr_2814 [Halorhabdus sp. SVX81]WEL22783.1 Uncharacterized protein HBNXHr_2753 [Halorhabdus sp. BNX81]